MKSDIPILYTEEERRILPLRERIIECITNHPEPMTLVEIIGLLELIKSEFIETYY